MELHGLVPARGGSCRIPGKNLKDLGSRSLLAHAVLKLLWTGFGIVSVSTEDDQIAREAELMGAKVHRRPRELAEDETPMIDVVRDYFDAHPDCDGVVLHQCTAPLTTLVDLIAVADRLASGADYVATVIRRESYCWPDSKDPIPFWKKQHARGRRADIVETGGAYGIARDAYERPLARLDYVEQESWQHLDIDEPWELDIARAIWPLWRKRVCQVPTRVE